MKNISGKAVSFLLLLIIILLFLVNINTGVVVEIIVLAVLFYNDKKCIRMFLSIGFLVFMIIAIGVPVAVDFSLDELQRNAFILFRGVLIFLCIFFYTRNFTSSGAYARLKPFLLNQLIALIQMSIELLPEMQKTAYAEVKKAKISRKRFFEPLVDFFNAFIKVGENP